MENTPLPRHTHWNLASEDPLLPNWQQVCIFNKLYGGADLCPRTWYNKCWIKNILIYYISKSDKVSGIPWSANTRISMQKRKGNFYLTAFLYVPRTVLGALQTLSLKSLNNSMKPSFRGIWESLQVHSFPPRLRNLGVKWLEAEQLVLPLPWSGGIIGGDGKVQMAPGGLQSTKSCLGWIIYTHCGPQEGDHLGWPSLSSSSFPVQSVTNPLPSTVNLTSKIFLEPWTSFQIHCLYASQSYHNFTPSSWQETLYHPAPTVFPSCPTIINSFQWSCMDVRVGLWRKLSDEELMLLNCGVREDSWESLALQGDSTSPFWRRSALGSLWKEWC